VSSWVVYSRSGCKLCEDFLIELAALIEAHGRIKLTDVQVVDIDGDPELTRRYFDRIPVLTVNEALICQYQLDSGKVLACLDATGTS
jgi:hypothetical protein